MKKIIIFISIFATAIGSLCNITLKKTSAAEETEVVETVDVWDGTTVSTSLTALDPNAEVWGTEDNPYLIQSGADLKFFADKTASGYHYSGKYFKLIKSIDLNNSNFIIGSFGGVFDGDNNYIKGLSIESSTTNTGLFTSLLETGTIKNLTLYGTVSGVGKIGAFVGTSDGTIENCVNHCIVRGNGQRGGIVGVSNGLISNCTNNGDTTVNTSGWNVGGIVGESSGDIINCINNAKVYGTTTHIAGIVGSLRSGNVTSCENNGDISGATWGAGGIVGCVGEVSCEISNCTNKGAVSGTGQIGGIVGKCNGIIADCNNYGAIELELSSGGGIAGDCLTELSVYNSNNYGVVSSVNGDDIGGIVGYVELGEVKNCTNNSTISGKGNVGGLVGYGNCVISESYNTADVTGTDTYVGGIAGQINSGSVSDCSNSGNITGTILVDGIVGWPIDGSVVSNCENTGIVIGSNGQIYPPVEDESPEDNENINNEDPIVDEPSNEDEESEPLEQLFDFFENLGENLFTENGLIALFVLLAIGSFISLLIRRR